ncbi:hypothetical protein QTP81_09440 [Alteromonas sp. ASW11-36]|uniref:Uncharacterized protein n=1 Tax=Alteromonas arenosi TaxID=3055817 RepID=A0ABT7SX93_9ALTE|nr:hypothetical protein [Alteromonas sp. ASW11-36]MDM7860817.1 hypothetical protein [Alteromonas sp. ASW11-36]
MDARDARIAQLEKECSNLVDSLTTIRMKECVKDQTWAQSEQGEILKRAIRHARETLGDDFMLSEPER